MSISPSANTAIRAIITFIFLVGGGLAPWLTPAHALAVVASLVAILGGILALLNLFHVPGKAVAIVANVVDVLKTIQGDIPAQAVAQLKKIAVFVLLVGFALHTTACISSAPIVPETPANQAQIQSCQSTAATHNGLVFGDFTVGGLGAASGIFGAALSDAGQKTAFSTGAAVAGVGAGILTALVSYTAANFANSKCPDVVGPLPPTPFGGKPAAK